MNVSWHATKCQTGPPNDFKLFIPVFAYSFFLQNLYSFFELLADNFSRLRGVEAAFVPYKLLNFCLVKYVSGVFFI